MKKRYSTTVLVIFVLIFILVVSVFVRCIKVRGASQAKIVNNAAAVANDSLAFGDTKWVSDGLKGKIYFLPENTSQLPAFDTMHSEGTIYTRTLNIPTRGWETGFPGVPNRFEWFGIEYKGNFRVRRPGHYSMRILSDDGAKLFIDGKLIINNDGTHGPSSASGEVDIDGREHSITVQYYQGPRYLIALQLFATLDKGEEQLFPGDNFILITPGSSDVMLYIIIIVAVLLVAIVSYWYIQRKRLIAKA